MAMLNIEYRHSERVRSAPDVRRTSEGMERYLESLVKEMRTARISAEYIDSVAIDGEKNSLLINGTNIIDILDGLKIVPLDDDDHCDTGSGPKMVSFGRPPTDWNREYIEDIPDVFVKNAISKTYSRMTSDE